MESEFGSIRSIQKDNQIPNDAMAPTLMARTVDWIALCSKHSILGLPSESVTHRYSLSYVQIHCIQQ